MTAQSGVQTGEMRLITDIEEAPIASFQSALPWTVGAGVGAGSLPKHWGSKLNGNGGVDRRGG